MLTSPVHPYLEKYCTLTEEVCLFYRGPFGQWRYTPFSVAGVEYNCAEQWMMAQKALLFGDHATHAKIMEVGRGYTGGPGWLAYPARQQKLGRLVANYDEATWHLHRERLVVFGNVAKMRQYPDIASALRSTGERRLAEASPIDRIWGIGMDQRDPAALNPANWRGLNLLGQALQQVRAALA